MRLLGLADRPERPDEVQRVGQRRLHFAVRAQRRHLPRRAVPIALLRAGLDEQAAPLRLVVFGIEYILRFWSAAEHAHFAGIWGRLRWAVTPSAIIDLLAIAPALLITDMRLVRILRLARLVRIAKLGRYSIALRTLRHVVVARLPDLIGLSFVLLILLVLSSAIMFHLENEAQPTVFTSIPVTMWWGIVTLTTIGYGDMAPITLEGRLLGAVVAVLGIGMFALPAGLLGGAFVEELGKVRRQSQGQTDNGNANAPAMTHCPHWERPLATD